MEYIINLEMLSSMEKTIYSKEHKYIVNRLKEARKESGFDQKQVARLLKKTQSYVSKIESGQRRIDVVQLRKFGKIYNRPISYFFS